MSYVQYIPAGWPFYSLGGKVGRGWIKSQGSILLKGSSDAGGGQETLSTDPQQEKMQGWEFSAQSRRSSPKKQRTCIS